MVCMWLPPKTINQLRFAWKVLSCVWRLKEKQQCPTWSWTLSKTGQQLDWLTAWPDHPDTCRHVFTSLITIPETQYELYPQWASHEHLSLNIAPNHQTDNKRQYLDSFLPENCIMDPWSQPSKVAYPWKILWLLFYSWVEFTDTSNKGMDHCK